MEAAFHKIEGIVIKKSLLGLMLLLTGCTPVDSTLISANHNLRLPTPQVQNKYICIMSELPIDWSLNTAKDLWNANGKNILTERENNCDGQVEFWMIESDKFFGEIRFLYRNYALIYFNVQTPQEIKLHVLCHELGHVLGLPHSSKFDTCMNINLLVTVPSSEDLQAVRNDLWDWDKASRQATGY